ncbi:MAG: threonine--tRNA ligase [Halobacteriaceae archaeon]
MVDQSIEQIEVTLPDGSDLAVDRSTTVHDVARKIGEGLARDAVAGIVDGDLAALEYSLQDDAFLRIITPEANEYLRVLRHSAAHVFGQALQGLYPEAKLAIGPPTDEGFYYDVANVELDEDDLDDIESEMEEIIKADYSINRVERSREEAFDIYANNPYKQDILETEAEKESTVTFYVQNGWQDLCEGPHVESTGKIGAISLESISSAYWRGDESNPSLLRVHGTAFETEEALQEYKQRQEKAKQRDHRRLGQKLDLFSVPDHSPGCVHFHPNGMEIRRELAEYIRAKNNDLGYEEVWTPELNKTELWKPTGHYDTFKEAGEMFAWEQDGTEYGLKPMNCANHAHLYDRTQYSYRDLPVRFSEFGTVYRNEQSGELSGLLRVRGLTQDDGHAFIRPDQIEDEIIHTLQTIEEIYSQFDLEVLYKLETKGDTAIGDEEIWEDATQALINALEHEGLTYEREPGEAAFYGPKIGLDVRDALDREWTIGTIQVDFNIPRRLDLSYIGSDNEPHTPVMIHRALLGSFERFIGIITEHFGGKFPFWLAPEQIRILPISNADREYANDIADRLSLFRVSVDTRDWTISRKIRQAHDEYIPYMIIVGSDERKDETISIRDRQERESNNTRLEDFRDHLLEEYSEKHTNLTFISQAQEE